MKKVVLSLVALSALTANVALARRGGDDGAGDDSGAGRVGKNTAAGRVAESLEHSLRLLALAQPGAVNDVVSGSSAYDAADQTSVVVIELVDGTQLTYNCAPFQDVSKGGTVVKTEMRCALNK